MHNRDDGLNPVYVSVQGLQKRYGATLALSDVALTLRRGEILALLGPNGAGKTTLIKILATLLRKSAGSVSILGYDLDREENAIRHLFGYVGQDTERSAYGRLSVVENLRFFGALRGLRRAAVDQQIEKLAAAFEFHGALDKQFMQLSGGQKQTVVIMRALLHDPRLIYLDEPTKGLDPLVAQKIRRFLKQYVHGEGKALLLTSHILPEVDELADRVALIYQGRIVVDGTPASLKAALGATELIELQRETLPQATIERILALPEVAGQVARDAGWVSFGIHDLLGGTEQIIKVLREGGVETRLRYHTVSLEDAFIHHVGGLVEQFEH